MMNLAMWLPSTTELLVILAVVVVLFGASRIPKLARAVGQSLVEFRRGADEFHRIDKEDDDETT